MSCTGANANPFPWTATICFSIVDLLAFLTLFINCSRINNLFQRYANKLTVVSAFSGLLSCGALCLNQAFPDKNAGVDDAAFQTLG